MKLKDYEDLPDGLSKEQVAELCKAFVLEWGGEYKDDTLDKIHILGDKQWHSYETPDEDVKNLISSWLDSYMKSKKVEPDLVIYVAYCFALEKRFYTELAIKHPDLLKDEEYLADLENSQGEFLNPYWTLERHEN